MASRRISLEKAVFVAFLLLVASLTLQLFYILPQCNTHQVHLDSTNQLNELSWVSRPQQDSSVLRSPPEKIIKETEEKSSPQRAAEEPGGSVKKEAPPPRTEPRKILLFAYPRTGSSVTGAIISKSPNVNYYYEPSYILVQKKKQTNETVLAAHIQKMFTCKFSVALLDDLNLKHLKIFGNSSLWNRCNEHRKKCVQEAATSCKQHKMTVKTIRLSMRSAGQLLDKNPDLVVIVLQRDPRASIYSHMLTFNNVNPKELQGFAQRYCSFSLENLEEARRLLSRHPGQIRFVRYERMVDDPVRTFRNLFDYVQLDWTKGSIEKHVKQLMGSRSESEGSEPALRSKVLQIRGRYTLSRSDASAAASSWRRDIPVDYVTQINEECKRVMDLLGYHQIVKKTELRNISVPSVGNFKYLETLPFYGMDLSP